MASGKSVKCALFGYGRAGKIHYNTLSNSNMFNLKYLVEIRDVSSEISSDIEYVNFHNTTKIKQIMTDDSIHAIFITTPTLTHFDLVILSLNHNKHVFVEKPLVDNLDQINECFDLAYSKNRVLFVGYNRRFDNKLMDVKKRLEDKEIGKVNYAQTISRDYPYPTQEYLKISSGIFHDCATHDIDYMNWLLNDKPISVYVHGSDDVSDYNFDHVCINLKYSLGTLVTINLSRISSNYDQRCEFYGDKGEILNNEFTPNMKDSFPQRYAHAFISEVESFGKCINEKIQPSVTLEDCINNHIIAEACQDSFNKSSKITIKYSDQYRDYTYAPKRVYQNYLKARTNQTFNFSKKMIDKFSSFDKKMELWDILEDLNSLVDVSDPDISHPNLFHAFQTAEMIRKDGHSDWMQLVGLIHDIGKIMYKKGCDEEGTGINEQWAMVGDTFIVGCKLSDRLIYPEFNNKNPDMKLSKYNSNLGIYSEGCGLDNVTCSWGHDEYLYRILTCPKNTNSLPPEALHIIRYHSLYAYHDKKDYFIFQSQTDKEYFPILKTFNKYDLYSKCDELYDTKVMKEYYSKLINKYFKNSYLYI